ncbi:MAG: RNA polymerase subunit sigma-24, partial [bacterium]|nr:RNA polymerase subunit sigma-24 [bacterium]
MNDSDLIEHAKQEPDAFAELYERYSQKVYKYFWFHTNFDKDVSEDLTQETFVRAYKHLAEYKEQGYSYGTYLTT